jgi:hypothetical protein
LEAFLKNNVLKNFKNNQKYIKVIF